MTGIILLKCPECGKESKIPNIIIRRIGDYLTRLIEHPPKRKIDLDFIINNIFQVE